MNAGPGGGVGGERAVIVTAGIVQVPEQRPGIETILRQPIGKRFLVESGVPAGEPNLQRNREAAGRTKSAREIGKAAKLFTVRSSKVGCRLNALLPAPVKKQTLLGIEAKISFIPLA